MLTLIQKIPAQINTKLLRIKHHKLHQIKHHKLHQIGHRKKNNQVCDISQNSRWKGSWQWRQCIHCRHSWLHEKGVYINLGDILLIQRRSCLSTSDKYDIIYKYSPPEAKYLQSIKAFNFGSIEQDDQIVHFGDDNTSDWEEALDVCKVTGKAKLFDRDKK